MLIQSLCKLGNDEVLIYIAFEDLFNSQLLFATKNGLVKLVSGIEFETIRSTINATKLDDGDELIAVRPLSAEEIHLRRQQCSNNNPQRSIAEISALTGK